MILLSATILFDKQNIILGPRFEARSSVIHGLETRGLIPRPACVQVSLASIVDVFSGGGTKPPGSMADPNKTPLEYNFPL